MDLVPSSEQSEIIESSRAFVSNRMSIDSMRELLEAGSGVVDEKAWSAAAELGWFALGLPEAHGGIGAGLVDEALLLREIGRGIAPGPFVSTMLAARVAAFGGHGDLAEQIASGSPVGLVVPDSNGVQLIDAIGELVLVITPDNAAIVEVAALRDVVAVPCVDPAVTLHRAAADAVSLVSVSSDVDPIERRAHVLVAAGLTGIVEAARDTAAEHAINRVQFDRPIGVNQAVKHPCADMAVRAELAYAQTLFAALAIDEGRPDAEFHALSAHLAAADAATKSTAATIQILGAMGFTSEHDAHLFMKRAHVWSQMLGGASQQLARLLALDEPR